MACLAKGCSNPSLTPQSEIAAYLSSIEWVVLAVFIFCLSIPLPVLRIVPSPHVRRDLPEMALSCCDPRQAGAQG